MFRVQGVKLIFQTAEVKQAEQERRELMLECQKQVNVLHKLIHDFCKVVDEIDLDALSEYFNKPPRNPVKFDDMKAHNTAEYSSVTILDAINKIKSFVEEDLNPPQNRVIIKENPKDIDAYLNGCVNRIQNAIASVWTKLSNTDQDKILLFVRDREIKYFILEGRILIDLKDYLYCASKKIDTSSKPFTFNRIS